MIKRVIRFFATLWGWFAIAALTAGLSFLAIDAQARHAAALDLRAWQGE